MTDREIPLKEGFLWFPPHGVLGQLKKSWQKKYCQLFRRSKTGVDRLEVFDGEDIGKTSSNNIITLENCIKISQDAQKHQPHVFLVITKSNNNYFSANSDEEMNEWISAFQAVAFKDNISRQTIEEDNDLYCTSGDAGVFNVKLVSSDASNRCGLSPGYYTLLATPTAVQLLDSDNQKTLYTWPYRYIRRYGYRNGKFSFEAGRKCETGEGVFMFEHSREIFRCIATRMKYMKKLLSPDLSGVHTHSLLCGDNQFQAALSMVPGTRSPLPPSPTSATPLPDSAETLGFSSLNPLIPYFANSPFQMNGGGGGHETTSLPPLMPKLAHADTHFIRIPEKPALPPKVSPSLEMENGFASSEEALETSGGGHPAYDDVEVRKEAWRTMGVEVINQPNVFKTISMQKILSQTSPSPPKASLDVGGQEQPNKVIFAPVQHANDYNRLQHFGPTAKPAHTTGYQKISLLSNTMSSTVRIEDEPIFACRRADDFKGYGMIRKKASFYVEHIKMNAEPSIEKH